MVVPGFGFCRLHDCDLSTDISHRVMYLARVYIKIRLKSLFVPEFLYLQCRLGSEYDSRLAQLTREPWIIQHLEDRDVLPITYTPSPRSVLRSS